MADTKMSHNFIHRAIRDNTTLRLRGHKLLMHTLVTYGNSEGKNIFPGRKRLAQNMNCSLSTIIRYLGELERGGFISTPNKKGGRGNVTHYEICLVKLGLVPDFVQEPTHNIAEESTIPPPVPPELDADEQYAKLRQRVASRQEKVTRNPQHALFKRLLQDAIDELRQFERNLQHAPT